MHVNVMGKLMNPPRNYNDSGWDFNSPNDSLLLYTFLPHHTSGENGNLYEMKKKKKRKRILKNTLAESGRMQTVEICA